MATSNNQSSSSNSSTIRNVIIVTVVIIVFYIIYKLFIQKKSSSVLFKLENTTDVSSDTSNIKPDKILSVINNGISDYSLKLWIFVNSWEHAYGKQKYIFKLLTSGSGSEVHNEMYFHENTNTISLKSHLTSGGSSVKEAEAEKILNGFGFSSLSDSGIKNDESGDPQCTITDSATLRAKVIDLYEKIVKHICDKNITGYAYNSFNTDFVDGIKYDDTNELILFGLPRIFKSNASTKITLTKPDDITNITNTKILQQISDKFKNVYAKTGGKFGGGSGVSGSGGSGKSDNSICNVEGVPLQKWICLIVTYHGSFVDIYGNGKLYSTCKLDGTLKALKKGCKLEIGVPPSSSGETFSGYISDFELYKTAINPAKAYEIYKAGNSMTGLSTLVNKFKFKFALLEHQKEVSTYIL